jgi:hypothetical protein
VLSVLVPVCSTVTEVSITDLTDDDLASLSPAARALLSAAETTHDPSPYQHQEIWRLAGELLVVHTSLSIVEAFDELRHVRVDLPVQRLARLTAEALVFEARPPTTYTSLRDFCLAHPATAAPSLRLLDKPSTQWAQHLTAYVTRGISNPTMDPTFDADDMARTCEKFFYTLEAAELTKECFEALFESSLPRERAAPLRLHRDRAPPLPGPQHRLGRPGLRTRRRRGITQSRATRLVKVRVARHRAPALLVG